MSLVLLNLFSGCLASTSTICVGYPNERIRIGRNRMTMAPPMHSAEPLSFTPNGMKTLVDLVYDKAGSVVFIVSPGHKQVETGGKGSRNRCGVVSC